MNPMKVLPAVGLAAGLVWAAMGAAAADPVTPAFDVFGPLPAATFGGSGIPNDAVAITTIVDGGNTITLGMSASERYVNAPVGDDGAGTFSAEPGSNFGDPTFTTMPSTTAGATWNFNFYVSIAGGGVIGDYDIRLFYDFDPGAATDETLLGVIDFNGLGPVPLTLAEGSENLLFATYSTPIPGLIAPPPGAFDPDADGEYSFALRVADSRGALLGESAINVIVGDGPETPSEVPEPATIALFGLGLLGLGCARRRRAS